MAQVESIKSNRPVKQKIQVELQKHEISAHKTAKLCIKKCGPIYNKQSEKSCGTQGGGQEMAVIVD